MYFFINTKLQNNISSLAKNEKYILKSPVLNQ